MNKSLRWSVNKINDLAGKCISQACSLETLLQRDGIEDGGDPLLGIGLCLGEEDHVRDLGTGVAESEPPASGESLPQIVRYLVKEFGLFNLDLWCPYFIAL